MNINKFLKNLREAGAEISAHDGQLKINAPAGLLNDEAKELIKANKPQIVAALDAFRQLHDSPYFTGYTGLSLF